MRDLGLAALAAVILALALGLGLGYSQAREVSPTLIAVAAYRCADDDQRGTMYDGLSNLETVKRTFLVHNSVTIVCKDGAHYYDTVDHLSTPTSSARVPEKPIPLSSLTKK